MPKHPLKAARLLFVLSILAALLLPGASQAGDKGVGVLLSVTTLFPCAAADMSIGEGACKRIVDRDSVVVGSVNVTAIACKGPADVAGLKLADVIVSINGVNISGLTQDAYEDLIDMASSGGASWGILRKSFGRWEKKELMLLPGELGDDFSCGKPDSET